MVRVKRVVVDRAVASRGRFIAATIRKVQSRNGTRYAAVCIRDRSGRRSHGLFTVSSISERQREPSGAPAGCGDGEITTAMRST